MLSTFIFNQSNTPMSSNATLHKIKWLIPQKNSRQNHKTITRTSSKWKEDIG